MGIRIMSEDRKCMFTVEKKTHSDIKYACDTTLAIILRTEQESMAV